MQPLGETIRENEGSSSGEELEYVGSSQDDVEISGDQGELEKLGLVQQARATTRTRARVDYAEMNSPSNPKGERALSPPYDEMANESEEPDIPGPEEQKEKKNQLPQIANRIGKKTIDKILAHRDKMHELLHKERFRRSGAPSPSPSTLAVAPGTDSSEPQSPPPPEYEYLVKWRHLSYIHCEWVDESVVREQHMGQQRLTKFFRNAPEENPEDPFNPIFVEVDRVLDEHVYEDKTYFLVKWQGLQYSESTWELSSDIEDDEHINQFRRRNVRPPPSELVVPDRPPSSNYKPIHSREFKDGNQLRSYQLEGLNWLAFSWYNQTNTILADEMGLGKTVQAISILHHLYTYEHIRGPFLVIVPLSTLVHWSREFESWTEMNAVVYHGNVTSRDIIKQCEWYYRDANGQPDTQGPYKFNAIITTYETFINDRPTFQPIHWQYVIIDEAHRLKNKSSRSTSELEKLSFDHITLLTGTPIQNNVEELWTLLNILDRERFKSWPEFEDKFGELKESSQVAELQEILRPYLLRRMKEDVEKTIAPKEETIIEVELTHVQKKYYRSIYERNFDNLVQKGSKVSKLPSLMNVMMQLRKCCNHPYLLQGVEEAELQRERDPQKVNQKLIDSSGKLVLIDKLLPKLQAGGHKVLIFSQMVHVLDLLQDYLNYRKYRHERIDGGVRGNDRQLAIDRFSKPGSDSFVFLLCTRAGGLGINLTAADTVIIFDSDWNPQNDLQAQARCHRIGQEKKVKIYRLITRNTYERQMFDRASLKLGLDHAVLSNVGQTPDEIAAPGEQQEEQKKLSAKEVDLLLKNGAYAILNEDDASFEKFNELDIDQILQERTQTIVHEAVGSRAQASSTFAKATFTVSSSEPELDVNDPEFWKKMMPEAAKKPNKDIINEPRVRKQTQKYLSSYDRYGEEEDDSDDLAMRPEGADLVTWRQKWTAFARNRLVRGLLNFGFGRWKIIRESSNLRHHTDADLLKYSISYLRKLSNIANADLRSLLQQSDNTDPLEVSDEANNDLSALQSLLPMAPAAEIDPEAQGLEDSSGDPFSVRFLDAIRAGPIVYDSANDVLHDKQFTERLMKAAPLQQKRLVWLARLGKIVRQKIRGRPIEDFPYVPASRDLPVEWGPEFDRALLMGIYKHGFGKFDLIFLDPELPFIQHFRLVDAGETKKGKGKVEGGEDFSSSGVMVSSSGTTLTLRTRRASKADAEAPNGMAVDSVAGEPSLQPDQPVPQLTSEPALQPDVTPSSPSPLASPPAPSSAAPSESSPPPSGDAAVLPPAPPISYRPPLSLPGIKPQALTARCKKLIKLFFGEINLRAPKATKSKGRKSTTPKKSKKSKLATKPKKVKTPKTKSKKSLKDQYFGKVKEKDFGYRKDSEWSKKDVTSLYRLVITAGLKLTDTGLVDWDWVRRVAGLYGKSEKSIIEHYIDLIRECRKVMVYMEKPEKEKKLHPESHTMTLIQAKRVLERITFFSHLRRHLLPREAELESKFTQSATAKAVKKAQLPDWWKAPEYDIALLKGVAKYGMSKWEKILADRSLAFWPSVKERLEEAGKALPPDPSLERPRKARKTSVSSTPRARPRARFEPTRSDHRLDEQVITQELTMLKTGKVLGDEPEWKQEIDRELMANPAQASEQSTIVQESDILTLVQAAADAEREAEPSPRSVGDSMDVDANPYSEGHRLRRRVTEDREFEPGDEEPEDEEIPQDDEPEEPYYYDAPAEDYDEDEMDEISDRRSGGSRKRPRVKKAPTPCSDVMPLPMDQVFFKRLYHLLKKGMAGIDTIDPTQEGKTAPALTVEVPELFDYDTDEFARSNPAPELLHLGVGAKLARRKGRNSVFIERDSAGNIIYPISVGPHVKILNLGEIKSEMPYHTNQYFYTVGFKSTRPYVSTLDLGQRTDYVCEILEGDNQPSFKVTACDDPENPAIATSASTAWKIILDRINLKRADGAKRTSVSGPDFFGFSHPVIIAELAKLPGADKCEKFGKESEKKERGPRPPPKAKSPRTPKAPAEPGEAPAKKSRPAKRAREPESPAAAPVYQEKKPKFSADFAPPPPFVQFFNSMLTSPAAISTPFNRLPEPAPSEFPLPDHPFHMPSFAQSYLPPSSFPAQFSQPSPTQQPFTPSLPLNPNLQHQQNPSMYTQPSFTPASFSTPSSIQVSFPLPTPMANSFPLHTPAEEPFPLPSPGPGFPQSQMPH